MGRQEFYVAASRSREETHFYATPEIHAERGEFAPGETAVGLEHIARAAERDGAQAAAHDAALRGSLDKLSTPELHARRHELSAEAGAEGRDQEARERAQRRVERAEEHLSETAEEWRRLGPEPGRFARRSERDAYRERLALLESRERTAREQLAGAEVERGALAPVGHQARAETAVIDHLLAERMRARLVAVRLDPPAYLVKELGERPGDGSERAAWDRGARVIEEFRSEHGIRDKDHALGREPQRGRIGERAPTQAERSRQIAREQAQRQLRLQQRQLAKVKERVRRLGRALSIGR
jgi:hypothetical protein